MMTDSRTLDTRFRDRHPVPAEFLEVCDSTWSTPDGPQVLPTLRFKIPENVLGLNLLNISDIVISNQGSEFGVEFIYAGESFDPNMLLMGAASLSATIEAWHEVVGQE